MANIFKKAWWILLLRGIAAILFALLLIFAPGITVATGALSFAILFGIYAMVDGVSTAAGAVMNREGQWVLLLWGLVGIIAGLLVFANPLLFSIVTITIMVYLFAFKAIAGGIIEIISAWQLRQEIDNEWMLMLSGVFSVLFGLILLRRPITAVEVLLLFTSFFLLVTGGLQIVLAFRMRGMAGKLEDIKAEIVAEKPA